MTNTELLKTFLREETVKGRRPQGLAGLRNRIPKLFVFLDETGRELYQLDFSVAQEYQGWLLETGREDGGRYSSRTIDSFIVAANAFCHFLKKRGIILENPFPHIQKIRVETKLPRNLPKEHELDRLLHELSRLPETAGLKELTKGLKVHVVCELMYSTGLRINEVAGLTEEEIDFSRGLVLVKQGKGGRSRTAYLNEYAGEILKLYVTEILPLLRDKRNGHRSTLFLTGHQNLGKAVNGVMKAACEKLKLPVITSHSLRHCLGFHLLRAGCSLRWIQAILGHKLMRNTEIYTKVDKESLKKVLDTYHPRRWRHEKTDGEKSPDDL